MRVSLSNIFLAILLIPLLTFAETVHKENSILATGQWYKLAVRNTGIYKVTFEDLQSMGIDASQIDPANIRLFGNGGGILSESNNSFRIDDLREDPILVNDGDDDHFDEGDYFLFYGESPDKWYFDTLTTTYSHGMNLYSDSTFYFLTFDLGPGKRILPRASCDSTPNFSTKRFDECLFHELDERNLIRSGKVWYGEVFDNTRNSYDFTFDFPNRDSIPGVKLKTYVAARCSSISRFFISVNGILTDSVQVDLTNLQSTNDYGKYKSKNSTLYSKTVPLTINLTYKLPTSNALGWLNYLEVVCQRFLIFSGPQMSFRCSNSVRKNWITEFRINKMHPGVTIWDVTDPGEIRSVEGTLNDDLFAFRCLTPNLLEFIAFDGSSFLSAQYIGPVANQNLHSLDPSKMVIVTNPLFRSYAEQLADFHREHDSISVEVVPTSEIYTEFACGQKDPTAIRDFMKMLYDKGQPNNSPKYLLLFGDGSYDPKDRVPGNNNMIPTFQATESLNHIYSYVCDDYFGIMGDNEGQESNGSIEIGVGRFPVTTVEQAASMIDKIQHYFLQTDSIMSDWRNIITFVADDEDDNIHFKQAEESSKIVAQKYPVFNVNKIYLDAYPMVKIPAGSRFPEANKALNQAISKGTLLINYTGHGGESGWSYEQVLTLPDIAACTNKNELPVFVTATCEFSRFDNPERFSGGEMVILHPDGGAIALYTTTRLSQSGSNQKVDTSFFRHLMDKQDGKYLSMGDLVRISKNNNSNNLQIRNWVLLGDPLQRITFPINRVKTTEISSNPLSNFDTILGMSKVTVSGIIEDLNGQTITSFDGILNAKIFDKPVTCTTLGNTTESYPANFTIQNSLLSEIKASVTAGLFNFDFIVPKDIALQFGKGKISYYASDGKQDANGYTDSIIIGGRDTLVDPDNQGPDIVLFLDDPNFISGGTTSINPVLLANLYDKDGINFVGLGIGHEITLVLDDDWSHSIVLNDYYTPQLNTITGGSLIYAFHDISPGNHKLTLKAWDMFDNSSEKEISFVVSSQLIVKKILNYPNPVSEYTYFWFEPTNDSGNLEVEIEIYNITGQKVTSLNFSYSENIPGPLCYWNGTDANGRMLNNGIYPYRIKFRGNNGIYVESSQKLMIFR